MLMLKNDFMEHNFDYYLINNTGEPNVPLLMCNDDINSRGTDFIYLDEFAQIEKPVYLALNPPVPPKPNLNVDFLELPSAVFSQKVADVLLSMSIEGYQLVPAIIVDNKKNEHADFWIENAYTCLKCFDDEKSIYEMDDFTETWGEIEKIVFDKEALMKIPLKNRYIFRSEEASEFVFYHKTIVDAIMAAKPINIKFIPIEKWCQGVQF